MKWGEVGRMSEMVYLGVVNTVAQKKEKTEGVVEGRACYPRV